MPEVVTGAPLVTAFDGRSTASLVAGGRLARLLEVPLVVVTAYRHDTADATPEADRQNERRFEAAEKALRRAATTGGDDTAVEYVSAPAGDPADALVALAEELDACAIVVTEDRHGSVTRDVLHGSPCPVVVTPSDPLLVPDRVTAVGVGYDGSVDSRFALLAAARLAERATSRLSLLAVGGRRDSALRRHLSEAAEGLPGDDVDTVLLHGDPTTALRGAAESVDLLVCGSHGRGRRLGALLGSVTAGLVRGPVTPVVVVPVRCRPDPSRPLGLSNARASRA